MATLVNSSTGVAPPKTIRFVNNAGHPPQKRRRINAACLTCRKRKTRCAGEHPSCSTCQKNGHVCLGYTDLVEKKKSHDGATIDQDHDHDDEDYFDEEPDDDRRHWKTSRNGSKQHESASSMASSRHIPEAAHSSAASSARPKMENVEWDDQQTQGKLVRRPTNSRNPSSTTDDGRSPSIRSPVQHFHESHRVPYFRYFGPTAIVPGFKQMVVKVRDRRRSSMTATSPGLGGPYTGFLDTAHADYELGHYDDMPVYDPNDTKPVHPIILNLVETFFLHLGCNYPFLREDRFPRMVKEKQVEPILVDSVCALAARFSNLTVFAKSDDGKLSPAEYGHVFAQRAKSGTVDTFPCPSVAAVQACLLMAYEGFGADQDSTLWMYLGLAIRMAVDLGLHKKDGVKFQGEKDPWFTRKYNRKPSDADTKQVKPDGEEDAPSLAEQVELEQERIDTLWSVFMLDRVISSGTGRPVTLRDEDFELELPKASIDSRSGLPDPFPNLIQIIHIYGRVSDILNNIRSANDLTQTRVNQLVQIERELTKLHQRQMQASQLQFNTHNFQQYSDNGLGTTFILLHFWFHALITVLNQPTLLTPFGKFNRVHELVPHSRELSMSSAKTIVDILAFASLINPRSFIGNPFTSQPIYIAACAFLDESSFSVSQPVSRDITPPLESRTTTTRGHGLRPEAGNKSTTRHFLLASAATQNHQSCYKALQEMHTYWGGVRYILTALDQRSQGVSDCETYTREEYESTKQPRRNGSITRLAVRELLPASPQPPPLAWSLTGTTNSPNSSLTLLYQGTPGAVPVYPVPPVQPLPAPVSAVTTPGNMIYDPIRQSLPETTQMFPPAYPQPNTSALRHSINSSQPRHGVSSFPQGKSLLGYDSLHSSVDTRRTPPTPESTSLPLATQSGSAIVQSYTPSSQHSSGYEPANYATGSSPASTMTDARPPTTPSQRQAHTDGGSHSSTTSNRGTYSSDGGPSNFAQSGLATSGYSYLGPTSHGFHLSAITYEDQAEYGEQLAAFEPGDMMQWFGDYFPNEVLGLYDMTGSSLG